MDTLVTNQAGLGFFGWLIIFAIIGAIPLIMNKGKDKKPENKDEEKK